MITSHRNASRLNAQSSPIHIECVPTILDTRYHQNLQHHAVVVVKNAKTSFDYGQALRPFGATVGSLVLKRSDFESPISPEQSIAEWLQSSGKKHLAFVAERNLLPLSPIEFFGRQGDFDTTERYSAVALLQKLRTILPDVSGVIIGSLAYADALAADKHGDIVYIRKPHEFSSLAQAILLQPTVSPTNPLKFPARR